MITGGVECDKCHKFSDPVFETKMGELFCKECYFDLLKIRTEGLI